MAWITDKGSPVSLGQCSSTQVCGCKSCCVWLSLWTGWSSSIFSWFGTIWLFTVPQHEETLGWEAVLDWWWGLICNWGLFRWSGWRLLDHGNPSAATPMEEVCGPQGILCWKLHHIWSNSTIASWLAYELFSPPSHVSCIYYLELPTNIFFGGAGRCIFYPLHWFLFLFLLHSFWYQPCIYSMNHPHFSLTLIPLGGGGGGGSAPLSFFSPCI